MEEGVLHNFVLNSCATIKHLLPRSLVLKQYYSTFPTNPSPLVTHEEMAVVSALFKS